MALALIGLRLRGAIRVGNPSPIISSAWNGPGSACAVGRNLVLIGYRGAGKSTLARKLKKILKMPLVSTDEELVARFGMPPIGSPPGGGTSSAARRSRWCRAPPRSSIAGRRRQRPNMACLRRSGVVFSGSARTLARRITQSEPSRPGRSPGGSGRVLARRDALPGGGLTSST
jgi:hypothetical protein